MTQCIRCRAALDFDPIDSLDCPREIGNSGNYVCIACARTHDDADDTFLDGLRAELDAATAGKSFYRKIYDVELTGDEFFCHSTLCRKLVVADQWDRNPVWLVESKHDDRKRRCCSLKCALIYAEEETEDD